MSSFSLFCAMAVPEIYTGGAIGVAGEKYKGLIMNPYWNINCVFLFLLHFRVHKREHFLKMLLL